jgi:outer membrane receptor protein involved in Fe transport
VAFRQLEVGLFVRNVTNADAFTYRGVGGGFGGGAFYGTRLRPRTIGLQLSRAF